VFVGYIHQDASSFLRAAARRSFTDGERRFTEHDLPELVRVNSFVEKIMMNSYQKNNAGKTVQLIVWTALFCSIAIFTFMAHNLHLFK
jgi:hypothetical protein